MKLTPEESLKYRLEMAEHTIRLQDMEIQNLINQIAKMRHCDKCQHNQFSESYDRIRCDDCYDYKNWEMKK